jgi:cell division ATPase FtsA
MGFGIFKTKDKHKIFLALDIGTQSIKALVFSISNNNGEASVLGNYSDYFSTYGFFGKKDVMRAIEKAIPAVIKGVKRDCSFSLADKEIKEEIRKKKKWKTLINLPPNNLKARIAYKTFNRKQLQEKISKIEQDNIYKKALEGTQEELSQKFAQRYGILPGDIQWLVLKIIDVRIDGYSVPALLGYKGENIELEILAVFLTKKYFEDIKTLIKKSGLEIFKITHPAENILSFVNINNGALMNIGEEASQFFLLKDGKIKQIGDFECGSNPFSSKIAQSLGIDHDSAKEISERYSNNLLSEESSAKIKNILAEEKEKWYNCFKEEIIGMSREKTFSAKFYLFGEGGLIPDIKSVLMEKVNNDQTLPFVGFPAVSTIYPKDLKNIKILNPAIKTPQIIQAILNCKL